MLEEGSMSYGEDWSLILGYNVAHTAEVLRRPLIQPFPSPHGL